MNKKQQKEMANRIKERRTALGYTQEEFSEKIEISASSYTKIENAFQKPSLDTIIKIAENLNISIDYLIHGLSEAKPREVENTEKIASLLEFLDTEKLQYISDLSNRLSKIKGIVD
jgi:transcriptional regulator with XRE-family HTH domain